MQAESYLIKREIKESLFCKNKKPLLGKLDFELTERCNNNCQHCYVNLGRDNLSARNRELTTENIKTILKEAYSLGCFVVRFTGGEPLLREDFQELYIFTRRLGLKVSIFTNATLITPQLTELFVNIPPLEKIEVTIYGMKKSSYEASTRVSGSFEASRRGINLLLEKGIAFVVKEALLPSNKDEIEEFEKWVKTIPRFDNIPSYSMFFYLRCRRDKVKNELIRKVRFLPEEGLDVLIRRKDEYIKEMKEFYARFMHPNGDKLFSCNAGIGAGCVDSYGYFQPCILLRHRGTVYDLRKGSLSDALTNFFPNIRKIRTTNPEYLRRCARCFLKGICEQCPAKSWTEHGTLDTPVDYFCEIAHVQARFLGLVKEHEKAWEVEDWQWRINKFKRRKYHGTKS